MIHLDAKHCEQRFLRAPRGQSAIRAPRRTWSTGFTLNQTQVSTFKTTGRNTDHLHARETNILGGINETTQFRPENALP